MTLLSQSPASVLLTGVLEPVGDRVWFGRKGSQRMKRWEFKLSITCSSPKAFDWGCFIGFLSAGRGRVHAGTPPPPPPPRLLLKASESSVWEVWVQYICTGPAPAILHSRGLCSTSGQGPRAEVPGPAFSH